MSDLLSKPLKGQVWVFTGEFEVMPHYEARSILEERGGSVEREVTEFTDFLVVGQNPGKKLETAKLLGVELVQGTDFKRKVIGETVAANRKLRSFGALGKESSDPKAVRRAANKATREAINIWRKEARANAKNLDRPESPNKNTRPFNTETLNKRPKPTFVVFAPLWVCLLAATFCLVAILGVIL